MATHSVLLPEKFHGQRSLAATVHGVTKSQTGLKYLASMRTPWGRVIVNNAVCRWARSESYGSSQVISEHVPSLSDVCGLLDSQEHVGSFQSPYFQTQITL